MLVAAALLGVITLSGTNPVGAIFFLVHVWMDTRRSREIAVLARRNGIVGCDSFEYILRDLLQMSVLLWVSFYRAYYFSILINNWSHRVMSVTGRSDI